VSNSPASLGLTPELVARFIAAQERLKKTSTESGASAATTPSGGTPAVGVSSSSGLTAVGKGLEDLDDRLIHLAHAERGDDAPPIDLYRTTPTEHGEVVTATPEFVAYMRRKFPGYGVGVHGSLPAPRRQDPPVGGGKDGLGKMKRYLAP
jgi:hypothetical protein